jgi:hypothetical protein
MSTKIIHTCKAPDGTEFTRTSASGRKYTHAVIVHGTNGYYVQCWNSRKDLAERERSRISSPASVVAVIADERAVKEKPVVEFPSDEFELEGFKFAPDKKYPTSRVAEFGEGWKVEVWKSGHSGFKARAIFRENWNTAVYTKGVGKLETTIRNIKKQIAA